MSKIGKINILIPKDVNVAFNNGVIDIKGPRGNKKLNLDQDIFDLKINDNKDISIKPKKLNKDTKRLWGMNRSLINNAVIGHDKHQVGVVTSKIKSFRPPEPYKGKGIRIKGEYILRKEGKKK